MEDDNNPFAQPDPFADASIRQATAQSRTNQQTLNEYNPFTNATVPARTVVQPAVLPSPPIPPPSYASVSTPISSQQQTTARVDFSQLERQQQDLDRREQRLMERERELKNSTTGRRDNNFPPIPKICPFRPCFYQDINVEIPNEFQTWVRYLFYLWIIYSATLGLNIIGALAYLIVDKGGAVTFGLSILYFVLFTPCS
ncbi:unnamed protein product [Didymodactylos carnosus]|uniref:Secretory carrier-associated membrane protein n=1 Tax=Didymodactylos carnosus TaxID=1234261 RepID=A0A814BX19_9BILA|nr:unnamed protein product [Didymodactylos carnosus]CAF1222452.1 unnamed protein product [Didymodactylos carnosus]CAF3710033.1 unnamed protein product [Didymodactylos carnosus]CAF4030545.1 unnamed protein product [Didymodactylos carnosus]